MYPKTPNKKKYESSILYLCKKLNGEIRGKKKLAKLLYYLDFDCFEKNNSSITEDIYKALPMGPFPMHLTNITSEMVKKKYLKIDTIQEFNIPTHIYQCLQEPDINVFSSKEKKMLDRVLLKYGHLSGKELENLSHEEAPYIGTLPGKEITYELAYYRGTDFSDL